MARACSICQHEQRLRINKALVKGEPLLAIARSFSVSRSALDRHRRNHLKAAIQRAAEREALDESYLLEELLELKAAAKALFGAAARDKSYAGAASALREARANIEVIGKITGSLSGDTTQVNILQLDGSEWPTLRARILDALSAFPDARDAVLLAIGGEPQASALESGEVIEAEFSTVPDQSSRGSSDSEEVEDAATVDPFDGDAEPVAGNDCNIDSKADSEGPTDV